MNLNRCIGNILCLYLTAFLLFFTTSFTRAFESTSSNSKGLKTLQLVQVLFRHGDRNQIYYYPNLNPDRDPESGQLTNIGKGQEFNLGQFLRRRYDGFISNQYESKEVSVLVSDMDRTIMSAEMVLAALYQPQSSADNWNPRIDWTPVPFRTISKEEDKILRMTKPCAKYTRLVDEIQKSEYMQTLNQENHDLIEYINQKVGTDARTVSEIVNIGDVLMVQQSHHQKMPAWGTEVEGSLLKLDALLMKAKTSTPELKRLRGGPLLDKFLENMVSNDKGISGKKAFLYSAHDATIMKLMATLDIFDPIMPPYSAALMMEMHQNSNGVSYVKVYYRNETDREPYHLHIPDCGSPCHLDRLIEITTPVISTDWEQECLDTGIFPSPLKFVPVTPIILGVGAMLLSVVSLIFMVGCKLEKAYLNLKKKPHVGYEAI